MPDGELASSQAMMMMTMTSDMMKAHLLRLRKAYGSLETDQTRVFRHLRAFDCCLVPLHGMRT